MTSISRGKLSYRNFETAAVLENNGLGGCCEGTVFTFTSAGSNGRLRQRVRIKTSVLNNPHGVFVSREEPTDAVFTEMRMMPRSTENPPDLAQPSHNPARWTPSIPNKECSSTADDSTQRIHRKFKEEKVTLPESINDVPPPARRYLRCDNYREKQKQGAAVEDEKKRLRENCHDLRTGSCSAVVRVLPQDIANEVSSHSKYSKPRNKRDCCQEEIHVFEQRKVKCARRKEQDSWSNRYQSIQSDDSAKEEEDYRLKVTTTTGFRAETAVPVSWPEKSHSSRKKDVQEEKQMGTEGKNAIEAMEGKEKWWHNVNSSEQKQLCRFQGKRNPTVTVGAKCISPTRRTFLLQRSNFDSSSNAPLAFSFISFKGGVPCIGRRRFCFPGEAYTRGNSSLKGIEIPGKSSNQKQIIKERIVGDSDLTVKRPEKGLDLACVDLVGIEGGNESISGAEKPEEFEKRLKSMAKEIRAVVSDIKGISHALPNGEDSGQGPAVGTLCGSSSRAITVARGGDASKRLMLAGIEEHRSENVLSIGISKEQQTSEDEREYDEAYGKKISQRHQKKVSEGLSDLADGLASRLLDWYGSIEVENDLEITDIEYNDQGSTERDVNEGCSVKRGIERLPLTQFSMEGDGDEDWSTKRGVDRLPLMQGSMERGGDKEWAEKKGMKLLSLTQGSLEPRSHIWGDFARGQLRDSVPSECAPPYVGEETLQTDKRPPKRAHSGGQERRAPEMEERRFTGIEPKVQDGCHSSDVSHSWPKTLTAEASSVGPAPGVSNPWSKTFRAEANVMGLATEVTNSFSKLVRADICSVGPAAEVCNPRSTTLRAEANNVGSASEVSSSLSKPVQAEANLVALATEISNPWSKTLQVEANSVGPATEILNSWSKMVRAESSPVGAATEVSNLSSKTLQVEATAVGPAAEVSTSRSKMMQAKANAEGPATEFSNSRPKSLQAGATAVGAATEISNSLSRTLGAEVSPTGPATEVSTSWSKPLQAEAIAMSPAPAKNVPLRRQAWVKGFKKKTGEKVSYFERWLGRHKKDPNVAKVYKKSSPGGISLSKGGEPSQVLETDELKLDVRLDELYQSAKSMERHLIPQAWSKDENDAYVTKEFEILEAVLQSQISLDCNETELSDHSTGANSRNEKGPTPQELGRITFSTNPQEVRHVQEKVVSLTNGACPTAHAECEQQPEQKRNISEDELRHLKSSGQYKAYKSSPVPGYREIGLSVPSPVRVNRDCQDSVDDTEFSSPAPPHGSSNDGVDFTSERSLSTSPDEPKFRANVAQQSKRKLSVNVNAHDPAEQPRVLLEKRVSLPQKRLPTFHDTSSENNFRNQHIFSHNVSDRSDVAGLKNRAVPRCKPLVPVHDQQPKSFGITEQDDYFQDPSVGVGDHYLSVQKDTGGQIGAGSTQTSRKRESATSPANKLHVTLGSREDKLQHFKKRLPDQSGLPGRRDCLTELEIPADWVSESDFDSQFCSSSESRVKGNPEEDDKVKCTSENRKHRTPIIVRVRNRLANGWWLQHSLWKRAAKQKMKTCDVNIHSAKALNSKAKREDVSDILARRASISTNETRNEKGKFSRSTTIKEIDSCSTKDAQKYCAEVSSQIDTTKNLGSDLNVTTVDRKQLKMDTTTLQRSAPGGHNLVEQNHLVPHKVQQEATGNRAAAAVELNQLKDTAIVQQSASGGHDSVQQNHLAKEKVKEEASENVVVEPIQLKMDSAMLRQSTSGRQDLVKENHQLIEKVKQEASSGNGAAVAVELKQLKMDTATLPRSASGGHDVVTQNDPVIGKLQQEASGDGAAGAAELNQVKMVISHEESTSFVTLAKGEGRAAVFDRSFNAVDKVGAGKAKRRRPSVLVEEIDDSFEILCRENQSAESRYSGDHREKEPISTALEHQPAVIKSIDSENEQHHDEFPAMNEEHSPSHSPVDSIGSFSIVEIPTSEPARASNSLHKYISLYDHHEDLRIASSVCLDHHRELSPQRREKSGRTHVPNCSKVSSDDQVIVESTDLHPTTDFNNLLDYYSLEPKVIPEPPTSLQPPSIPAFVQQSSHARIAPPCCLPQQDRKHVSVLRHAPPQQHTTKDTEPHSLQRRECNEALSTSWTSKANKFPLDLQHPDLMRLMKMPDTDTEVGNKPQELVNSNSCDHISSHCQQKTSCGDYDWPHGNGPWKDEIVLKNSKDISTEDQVFLDRFCTSGDNAKSFKRPQKASSCCSHTTAGLEGSMHINCSSSSNPSTQRRHLHPAGVACYGRPASHPSAKVVEAGSQQSQGQLINASHPCVSIPCSLESRRTDSSHELHHSRCHNTFESQVLPDYQGSFGCASPSSSFNGSLENLPERYPNQTQHYSDFLSRYGHRDSWAYCLDDMHDCKASPLQCHVPSSMMCNPSISSHYPNLPSNRQSSSSIHTSLSAPCCYDPCNHGCLCSPSVLVNCPAPCAACMSSHHPCQLPDLPQLVPAALMEPLMVGKASTSRSYGCQGESAKTSSVRPYSPLQAMHSSNDSRPWSHAQHAQLPYDMRQFADTNGSALMYQDGELCKSNSTNGKDKEKGFVLLSQEEMNLIQQLRISGGKLDMEQGKLELALNTAFSNKRHQPEERGLDSEWKGKAKQANISKAAAEHNLIAFREKQRYLALAVCRDGAAECIRRNWQKYSERRTEDLDMELENGNQAKALSLLTKNPMWFDPVQCSKLHEAALSLQLYSPSSKEFANGTLVKRCYSTMQKAARIIQRSWRAAMRSRQKMLSSRQDHPKDLKSMYDTVKNRHTRSGLSAPSFESFAKSVERIQAATEGARVRRRLKSRRLQTIIMEIKEIRMLLFEMSQEAHSDSTPYLFPQLCTQLQQKFQQLHTALNGQQTEARFLLKRSPSTPLAVYPSRSTSPKLGEQGLIKLSSAPAKGKIYIPPLTTPSSAVSVEREALTHPSARASPVSAGKHTLHTESLESLINGSKCKAVPLQISTPESSDTTTDPPDSAKLLPWYFMAQRSPSKHLGGQGTPSEVSSEHEPQLRKEPEDMDSALRKPKPSLAIQKAFPKSKDLIPVAHKSFDDRPLPVPQRRSMTEVPFEETVVGSHNAGMYLTEYAPSVEQSDKPKRPFLKRKSIIMPSQKLDWSKVKPMVSSRLEPELKTKLSLSKGPTKEPTKATSKKKKANYNNVKSRLFSYEETVSPGASGEEARMLCQNTDASEADYALVPQSMSRRSSSPSGRSARSLVARQREVSPDLMRLRRQVEADCEAELALRHPQASLQETQGMASFSSRFNSARYLHKLGNADKESCQQRPQRIRLRILPRSKENEIAGMFVQEIDLQDEMQEMWEVHKHLMNEKGKRRPTHSHRYARYDAAKQSIQALRRSDDSASQALPKREGK